MKKIFRKSDWVTVTFHRDRWPEGIWSWTYKRADHPWMWAIFGNDDDGVTPWARGKQWKPWAWWLRNRWHNIDYYLLGICHWAQDEVPCPSENKWYVENCIERRYWVGNDPNGEFVICWIRRIPPAKKSLWRPFIRFLVIPKLWIIVPSPIHFWWGFKPTSGHYCCGLKRA